MSVKTIKSRPVFEFDLVNIETPEVGDAVDIVTPEGTIRATWLGPVGDGPGAISLTEACRRMWRLAEEKGNDTKDG